jgi:hypothetical protein
MLLSALSKLLATSLVGVLVGLVLMTVLTQTVLSSEYVKGKLAATDSYGRLSVALTDEISQKVPVAENQQVRTKLETILTPQVLQTKIDGVLDQSESYYRGTGPLPVIDLTDLAAQAQAAGIPIPEDSAIATSVPLQASARGKEYSQTFDNTQTATIVGAVLLTAALLAVSWKRHKWVALPYVLIAVGVLIGLITVAIHFASGAAANHIAAEAKANAFSLIGSDLLTAIATDLVRNFGIIAVVFGVVGIGARILVGRIAAKVVGSPASPITKLKASQKPGIIN